MRLLFAISVASFCTVLWLALSLARRIRRDQDARKGPVAAQPPAMEFFEAGEFRTPRALRLNQAIAPQRVRRKLEDFATADGVSQLRAHANLRPIRGHQSSPDIPVTSVLDRDTRREIEREVSLNALAKEPAPGAVTSEAVIIDSKLHFITAETSQRPEAVSRDTSPRDISGERKSPQSARSGTFRRVDLSHYNKDMGDLTDPYTQSMRGSGIRPNVAKNG